MSAVCTCVPGAGRPPVTIPVRSCPVHGERPTKAGIASEIRRQAAALRALADRIDPPPERPDREVPQPSRGSVLAAAERLRQVEEEGHDPEHDAAHRTGELAWSAFCYLERAAQNRLPQDDASVPHVWPWKRSEWKPKGSRVRNLVVAAALVIAEIDRLLEQGEQE